MEVETSEDLDQALKMHKRDMGSRLVEGDRDGVGDGGGAASLWHKIAGEQHHENISTH